MKQAKFADDKAIKIRCTKEFKEDAHKAIAARGYSSLSEFIREKIDAEVRKYRRGKGKSD